MKLLLSSLVAVLLLASIPQDAAVLAAATPNSPVNERIANEVRHQLLLLPYYGVFDWLECEIRPDRSVVLRGEVTRPTTKSDAAFVVRKIEGIARVDNEIEVLPVSTFDDRIRISVYRSIFRYSGPMFRYATQSVPPIHIVVKNGRVALKGRVDSAMDSQLAYMAANGVSGIFEVRNELMVSRPVSKKK